MPLTYQSEIGKLHSLFIKNVRNAFIDDASLEDNWSKLNYTAKPDLRKAVVEYNKFESVFTKRGIQLSHFPEEGSVNMDSIYCRDASIATNQGMIICRMGKDARSNEPAAQRKTFEQMGIPVLGIIQSPGTLEGGDVAWLDEKTLAVGHTYRTNEEGIAQLKSLLEPLGIQILVVPLPHYKGASDVFHLMSILSPVDRNLAVVYSPLMPITFRNELLRRKYQLVEVPESEFESMGCNVLALEPRVCLIVSGNPLTSAALKAAGAELIEYEGAEISVKGGGGPTCLTRPLQRYE